MLPPAGYPEASPQPLVISESVSERVREPEKRIASPASPVAAAPDWSDPVPVVIARGKRRVTASSTATAPVTSEKQQISYQESIADTYIKLGQNKDAAVILEKLCKKDLPPDDRARIEKKLRECGG